MTKAKKKAKRKHQSDGLYYEFHGSYLSESKAKKKAKLRKGWVISRVPWGSNKRRYIVLTDRLAAAPF